jgi:CheY-like chemotaxis protein
LCDGSQDINMTEFYKVLVVDDGERSADHAISAELAELGFASVTTSLETTEEVLAILPSPTAILLQMPRSHMHPNYKLFQDLARRLQRLEGTSNIPVIVIDPAARSVGGGYAAALQAHVASSKAE